jgi:pimeloyl-ACP methyl ester carboxylesterase
MPRFTTDDGLSLHYEVTGPADPGAPSLLCLAGLTRNCRDFDPLLPHLGEVRVIAMDYRGRGLSDHDPDYVNYNVIRERRDAVGLLDHLGIAQTTVLGTSRGGLIAMAMAAASPERLRGVILNDVGPEIHPVGIAKIMDYLGEPPKTRDYDSCARAMLAASQTQFPDVPFAVWRRQAEAQFVEAEGRLDLRYDPALRRAVLELAASDSAPDLWLFFDALHGLPLGLIHGVNSDVLHISTVAEMKRRRPDMIVAHVPNRGHVPFLDEPESLAIIRTILEARP